MFHTKFPTALLVFAFSGFTVHMSLEIVRRPEQHGSVTFYLHLHSSLGIAADALALAAHHERAKAIEFHVLARSKGVRYLP